MSELKVRIITGKPYCDIPLGQECICLDTPEEIEARRKLDEAITVYWTNEDGEQDAYYVTAADIEIVEPVQNNIA